MDFNYLTMTQKVALLLGIIFSVLAVASTFFAFKHANKIKSKVLGLIFSLIMPFLAMTSWLILIFSFLDGFKNDDIMVIFVSIAISIVICLMILVISNALYRKHDKNMTEEVEIKEENKVVEAEPAQEEADENIEEVTTVDETIEETLDEETVEESTEESETEEVVSEEDEEIVEPDTETIEESEDLVEETTEQVVIEETEEIDTTTDDAE